VDGRRVGLSASWWGAPGLMFAVGGLIGVARGSYFWGAVTVIIGAWLLRDAFRRYRAGSSL